MKTIVQIVVLMCMCFAAGASLVMPGSIGFIGLGPGAILWAVGLWYHIKTLELIARREEAERTHDFLSEMEASYKELIATSNKVFPPKPPKPPEPPN